MGIQECCGEKSSNSNPIQSSELSTEQSQILTQVNCHDKILKVNPRPFWRQKCQ